MKKLLAVVLTLMLAFSVFTGCGEQGEGSDLNIYSEASYDNESRFVPNEEESKEGSDSESNVSDEENSRSENSVSGESNTPLSGEFVVKDKKYTFEGNDLVIVNVENQTNKIYSVTITGTYLDKNGNVLQTETQTFDQYYPGFSQYFLFEPGMAFDKFTYTFDAKESHDPICLKGIGLKYNGIKHSAGMIYEEIAKGNYTKYPTILASYSGEHTGTTEVNIWVKWLLVNESGEILFSFDRNVRFYPGDKYENGETHYELHQTKDEEWKCPEEWETMQAIPVFIDYTTDMQHLWPFQYPS